MYIKALFDFIELFIVSYAATYHTLISDTWLDLRVRDDDEKVLLVAGNKIITIFGI